MTLECDVDPPDSRPVAEKVYQLFHDYRYCWEKNGIQNRITVPHGFRYDGASVPRIAWTLSGIIPDGMIRRGALIHDWIYQHTGKLPEDSQEYKSETSAWLPVHGRWTRADADKLFARIMRESGVSKFKRRIAYLAVRAFGWPAWKR